MATLYVRNVPDDVYERLRAAAQEDGRSIAAQTTVLLREGLTWRGQRRESMERMVRTSPFKRRFARTAKELVLRAQELARERGAPEVLPAHEIA